MNPTLIAGIAFDAKDADRIRQTARIYSYARRIRRLATDAAPGLEMPVAPNLGVHDRQAPAPTPHRPSLDPRAH